MQEMTTCTSHSPPLVLHLIILHIYTSRLCKYTALLGPNVCHVGGQKVAPAQQLEEIGSMCSLRRSAYISPCLADLWNVCWEIKQIPSKAEVTVPCWNWPEVCSSLGTLTPLSRLGYKRSARKSWYEVSLSYSSSQSKGLKQSRMRIYRDRREEGQSSLCTWWIVCCKCTFNSVSDE